MKVTVAPNVAYVDEGDLDLTMWPITVESKDDGTTIEELVYMFRQALTGFGFSRELTDRIIFTEKEDG